MLWFQSEAGLDFHPSLFSLCVCGWVLRMKLEAFDVLSKNSMDELCFKPLFFGDRISLYIPGCLGKSARLWISACSTKMKSF